VGKSGGKVSLCVKKNHGVVDYPLFAFVTPLLSFWRAVWSRPACCAVALVLLASFVCAVLELVMSSFDISALFVIAFFFLVVGALCSSVVVLVLSLTCTSLAWYGVCTTILRR